VSVVAAVAEGLLVKEAKALFFAPEHQPLVGLGEELYRCVISLLSTISACPLFAHLVEAPLLEFAV
jgi:hypothetical protein